MHESDALGKEVKMMLGKVIDLLKPQMMIPTILFNHYRNLNITDQECIILIYLMNMDDIFNPKQMSQNLKMPLEEVLQAIASLTEKGVLKIDIVNKKVREEHVNLTPLYEKLAFTIINEEEKQENKTNLFDIFEKEFGRTLSPMDYEIIKDWQSEFTDELILLALKEAVFNGVTNLRYIDKIIRDWHKKGIQTEDDVIADRKKFQTKKTDKKSFDYDWLNERDH